MFMEPQITEKCDWYEIETTHGTWFVQVEDVGEIPLDQTDRFKQYVESGEVQSVTRRCGLVGYRLSAPGYLDRTEWGITTSRTAAKRELMTQYGDDDKEMRRAIRDL